MAFVIAPGALRLSELAALFASPQQLVLPDQMMPSINASYQAVQAVVARGLPAYGINTGFGKLAKSHIANHELQLLQTNLVRSHAVGVGPLLDDDVVRLILVLKAASLARGYSGVRPEVISLLLALVNHHIYPCIPAKGSVGASGDLAPLSHMTLTLLGEGNARVNGVVMPAGKALADAGLAPISLYAKEGLALLNGTQVSTALALGALFKIRQVFDAALIVGALSVDAARGSDAPFDERIHAVRGQPGQIATANSYRRMLAGSEIRRSHLVHDDRVQDPYSLRCQPQVMGACLDIVQQAANTLLIEANAVTDNPLIFGDEVLSGGNFHAEPVALAADTLALAVAEVGAPVGASHRAPDRLQHLWFTCIPDAPSGRQFRIHDCARDSGRTGIREQVAGPSCKRRQPAYFSQPGRPCQHGDLCCPAAVRNGREYAQTS